MTEVGLITKNKISAYTEVARGGEGSDVSLNVDKTKEMIIDFKRSSTAIHLPSLMVLLLRG